VFYSDYYGNPPKKLPMIPHLGKMMKLRHSYAYGTQSDYLDDPSVIGWVLDGDNDHEDSGLAVVISNGPAVTKRMFLGEKFAGEAFYDALGNCPEPVTIDPEGWGDFQTAEKNVSVWVRQGAFEDLTVNE